MIKFTQTTSIFVLGLFASACATEVGQAPEGFGASVNQNIEAQIANPDRLKTNEPIVSEGNRVQRAQSKYQKGDTETVETVDTQKSSSD